MEFDKHVERPGFDCVGTLAGNLGFRSMTMAGILTNSPWPEQASGSYPVAFATSRRAAGRNIEYISFAARASCSGGFARDGQFTIDHCLGEGERRGRLQNMSENSGRREMREAPANRAEPALDRPRERERDG